MKKGNGKVENAAALNSIRNNFESMILENNERIDAGFVDYCIKQLNKIYGQTRRYIFCRLLMSGLRFDELYSQHFEKFREEYDLAKK